MDSFDDDLELCGEQPPEGFDSFVYDEPSFIEDELHYISDLPDGEQPPGHSVMVSKIIVSYLFSHILFVARIVEIRSRKSQRRYM